MKVIHVNLRVPIIGAKCFVVEEKAIFVLERGAGTLQAVACTHAGSGVFHAVDGLPDENGFFPEEPEYGTDEYWSRNGRTLYKANPIVMGMWQLQAGFHHGLTLIHDGGQAAVSAIASIVWNPYRQRVAPAVPAPVKEGGVDASLDTPAAPPRRRAAAE